MYPILLELPHGGNIIPEEVEAYLRISEKELRWDSDEYSDEIYQNHDVLHEVRNPYWRACYDANRLHDDFSEDGVVKTHTSQGYQVYQDPNGLPPEVRRVIIEKYADPYFANLTKKLEDPKLKATLLCHTMPACGRGFRSTDKRDLRPLFMLGNDGNEEGVPEYGGLVTRALMKELKKIIQSESQRLNLKNVRYSDCIRFNNPYSLGSAIRLTKHMKKMPTLLLEINRDIPRKHKKNIPILREIVEQVIKKLITHHPM